MQGAFGTAGEQVVLEELLEGPEVSVFALTDGENVRCLPPARDYKRAQDGDRGPNTGGMGAICPCDVREEDLAAIKEQCVVPAVRGLKKEGRPFRGLLYAGIMLTKDGPKVLEYNCRFGDPETQAVMQILEGDLYVAMLACSGTGSLPNVDLQPAKDKYAVAVVLASEGYP